MPRSGSGSGVARVVALALAFALALGVGGCAQLAPPWWSGAGAARGSVGSIVPETLEVDHRHYDAHWYLPDGAAAALVLLEHGYARACRHLRGTLQRLMEGGLMALCIDAPMASGNPALADALASQLASRVEVPGGGPMPARLIVAGHSAGASFAARLGARLDALAPDRLAGALLYDPVDAPTFAADLRAVSGAGRRPVLATLATPDACNAGSRAAEGLLQIRREAIAAGRDGFVGVRLEPGSTHVDIEGEDSDWIAEWACGRPLPAAVERLRQLAVQWAQDLARGDPPSAALSAAPGSGSRPIE